MTKYEVQRSLFLFLLMSQIGKRRGNLYELRKQQKRNMVVGFLSQTDAMKETFEYEKKVKI